MRDGAAGRRWAREHAIRVVRELRRGDEDAGLDDALPRKGLWRGPPIDPLEAPRSQPSQRRGQVAAFDPADRPDPPLVREHLAVVVFA
jgi:hypothetical protein